MPTFEIVKLREHYNALKGIGKILDDLTKAYPSNAIKGDLILEYERSLEKANIDLPGLLYNFNKRDFYSYSVENNIYYDPNGIKANIARNLGILKSKIDEDNNIPVIQTKSFDFIDNEQIKEILKRDYLEIQRNLISSNWKSAIILSGGSIEAILLDLLTKEPDKAKDSKKVPDKTDLNKWDLNSLIKVAVEERFIEIDISKFSHTVREYRNLIHPGVEIRKDLKVEPEEAKIAVEILNILIREVS